MNRSLTGGVLLPNDIELEELVAGTLLLHSTAYSQFGANIKPEFFYVEKNKIIFESIKACHARHGKVDLIIVRSELKENGNLDRIGGLKYLTSLTGRALSDAHLPEWIEILKQLYIKRTLTDTGQRLAMQAYRADSNAYELIEGLAKEITGIITQTDNGQTFNMKDIVSEIGNNIFARADKQGITGFDYGFSGLNNATGGAMGGELIIIAARPAMGKTAFALQLALNLCKVTKVGFFSLEMGLITPGSITDRLVSNLSGVDGNLIKRGFLNGQADNVHKALNQLYELPLVIDTTSTPNEQQIRQKMYAMHQNGVRVFFVDYLQMIKSSNNSNRGNRNNELEDICSVLKATAKDLDVPIIALCQLSRDVEKRQSKKPGLSDLRDSGAIEQYGNIIYALFRPEYYGMTEFDNGQSAIGALELVPLKNRSGSLQPEILHYDLPTQKIRDFPISADSAKQSVLKTKTYSSFYEKENGTANTDPF